SDHARTSMGGRRIPDTQAVTPAAQIRAHDVKAEKGKARVVIDAGDRRGRRAVKLGDEKAFRIDGSKTRVIGEAWIPPLARGPLHGQRNFVLPHRPYCERVHGDGPQICVTSRDCLRQTRSVCARERSDEAIHRSSRAERWIAWRSLSSLCERNCAMPGPSTHNADAAVRSPEMAHFFAQNILVPCDLFSEN